jgi:hypothetical protein
VFYIGGVISLPGIELPPSDRAAFIMRPSDQELMLCRRYWQLNQASAGGWGTTSTAATIAVNLFPMRAAPAINLVDGSINGGSALDIQTAQRVVSAASLGGGFSGGGGRIDLTTAAATSYHPCILEAGAVSFNARL